MKQSRQKAFSRLAPFLMLAAALLCVLALAVFSGAAPRAETDAPSELPVSMETLPSPEVLRIAVASDTHLDPDNTDRSGSVSETVYNPEIVDAMLWDAREQGAKLLLITGDLCNSGKENKHAALVEKLRAAEKTGLAVYVLPGNHDLAPIRQTDFARLYADFGFDEAYSRDPGSLSYCVIRDGLMLLMMDTAGYGAGAIDLPGAEARDDNEAFFSAETLRWAEELLQKAREDGLFVLAAGHYNLLPELSHQPRSGYYLENGDRFAALLRQYGVPLYLSGHMHTRAVYEEAGLTEQLTECLIAYPTGYSLLDLAEDSLHVAPRRVDVDAWAARTGQTDPVLLHFADWQEQAMQAYCRTTVEAMAKRSPLTEQEQAAAADFFYAVMRAYWDGTLPSRAETLRAAAGYAPFFRCAEGYSYGWWLKDLMENASPKLAGYRLESRQGM